MTSTTDTRHSIVELTDEADERGSALLGVLLLLMMMSVLAAALGVSGQTETLISRNQRAGAQAQAAAEAGLNHAVELATTYIFEWSANGFASPEAAVNALLKGPDGADGTADDGRLGTRLPGITAAEAFPFDPLNPLPPGRLTITGGINAEYEAFVMDDTGTALGEEGVDDPFNDANGKVIIRATGYYRLDNTKVVLEALIGPTSLPALLVCGDLDIRGSVAISGAEGSIHANGYLDINGNRSSVSGTATASGTYTGRPTGSGGEPEIECPEVRASDYRDNADFILTSTGTMTNQDGTVVICAMAPCNNWDFDNSGGTITWSFASAAPPNGTYYVEGAVRITGSPPPFALTLIAEGSIDISGSPNITPATPELLLVTNGDLEISGGLDTGDPLTGAGQILVHEQIKFSGNPSLSGQVIVENAAMRDDLVTENEITGNVDIIYNGGLGDDSGVYNVIGWRDIRDVD